jgi:hypothetical protein
MFIFVNVCNIRIHFVWFVNSWNECCGLGCGARFLACPLRPCFPANCVCRRQTSPFNRLISTYSCRAHHTLSLVDAPLLIITKCVSTLCSLFANMNQQVRLMPPLPGILLLLLHGTSMIMINYDKLG